MSAYVFHNFNISVEIISFPGQAVGFLLPLDNQLD